MPLREDDEIVTIKDATLLRSTKDAGHFHIKHGKRATGVWIPWSQIDEGSIDRDGQHGVLYISEWIAEKKGLMGWTVEHGTTS